MAARKSIGNLHATVTANATQFVQEFSKAENVARRQSARIGDEVDRLKMNLAKKFSVSDLGKGLMQGLGIGSGLAVAQTAANMIVSHWEEAAKSAQRVEAATERQLKATRELIALRQNPQEQLDTLDRDIAKLQRQLAKTPAFSGRTAEELEKAGIPRTAVAAGVISKDNSAERAEIAADISELNLARERLAKSITESTKSDAARKNADAYSALIAAQDKLLDKADRVFNATRSNAEKFTSEMRELDDLAKRSVIDFDTYARRERQLVQQYLTPAATKPAGPDVDALQRIGGITGPARNGFENAGQKQVGLLTQIRDLLARGNPAAPIPKMTPIY